MIIVKRLGGASFALNPDLIERIESAPDTILVMVDTTRYIVEEPVEKVIDLIREDRAQLLARVEQILQDEPPTQPANGRAVLSVAYSASEKEEKEDE